MLSVPAGHTSDWHAVTMPGGRALPLCAGSPRVPGLGTRGGQNENPRSIEEPGVFLCQIASRPLRIELDAHAGAVPDLDHAVLDDRLRQAVDDVVPPGGIADRIFEGNEIVRQGRRDLDQRGETEEAVAGAVRRDHDTVEVG